MNCISRSRIAVLLSVALAACGAPASESAQEERVYRLTYDVALSAASGTATVSATVAQDDDLLREMRFDASPARYSDFAADGSLVVNGDRVTWEPPATGGTLSWRVNVPHRRGDDSYDALLTADWGLFRAEDIIPRAATRTLVGVSSDTRLRFEMPRRWSVATEYRERDGEFRIEKASRRFSQPSGWVVAGDIGVRRDRVAGVRVAIAAPEDQGVRRMDILAMLTLTLPELARIVPELPERLTVVSAGDPMWRGGLSAPQSIYLHADRPMISENGTSTLLHEVMHVAMGRSADGPYDWIVEGMAEYYSLQLLVRSGALSAARIGKALEQQAEWAASAGSLCSNVSTGATTALAVTVLAALDHEIRQASDGESSLDDVLLDMLGTDRPLDLELLEKSAEALLGRNPDALHIDKLPGCRKLAASAR